MVKPRQLSWDWCFRDVMKRSVVEGKRHHLGDYYWEVGQPRNSYIGSMVLVCRSCFHCFSVVCFEKLFEHIDVIEISAVNQGISTKLFPKSIEIMIC